MFSDFTDVVSSEKYPTAHLLIDVQHLRTIREQDLSPAEAVLQEMMSNNSQELSHFCTSKTSAFEIEMEAYKRRFSPLRKFADDSPLATQAPRNLLFWQK